ncbi:leucine-rich repeat domain-containing protein [Acidaminobacter hydrogenoformans]|uniref:Leucine Rich repeat-containing protein n=1 Tax=Acidaminobacter hydrogenoformans DSM 2784 TaxID=1120920 RepID=A0A1G5S0E2_9FIRM|nr:leucine-rich repeat domain-containing protein [Acidaminobacter hydrogenoformans]SCZ79450.1 Leucine Rich repeat-containing protein [Acidaminobacter hydrogenoformans DSM 2784]
MKRHTKRIQTILVLLLLVAAAVGCSKTEAGAPIEYSDPVFGELLKAELNKDTITAEDLDKFTRITIGGDHFISLSGADIPEKSIVLLFGTEVELEGVRYKGYGTMTSLEDLKHFRNLEKLQITLQPGIDYSTLPQEVLSKLRMVSITQSQLKSIEFLRGATSMFSLNLSFGEVEDLSPLVECKELVYLSGRDNPIKDLTPLAGLSKLKSISLYSGQIKDLTPLAGLTALETLELYDNQVEDLTPLSGLTSLKELELIDNNVTDVSPLKDLTNLESLRLDGNPVENIDVLSHMENLVLQP